MFAMMAFMWVWWVAVKGGSLREPWKSLSMLAFAGAFFVDPLIVRWFAI